jgi:hypothetical protein
VAWHDDRAKERCPHRLRAQGVLDGLVEQSRLPLRDGLQGDDERVSLAQENPERPATYNLLGEVVQGHSKHGELAVERLDGKVVFDKRGRLQKTGERPAGNVPRKDEEWWEAHHVKVGREDCEQQRELG